MSMVLPFSASFPFLRHDVRARSRRRANCEQAPRSRPEYRPLHKQPRLFGEARPRPRDQFPAGGKARLAPRSRRRSSFVSPAFGDEPPCFVASVWARAGVLLAEIQRALVG